MKKYVKTHAKHILLCLVYSLLTCVQQLSKRESKLFHSVFPLCTLYYGLLSVPKIHQIYEYNTVEQLTPKWAWLIRMYYHAVLLDMVPYASVISVFLLLLLLMWKDTRFLVSHAEGRLKAIDEALYANPSTKAVRICHLHLNAFDDDKTARSHVHYFNTNVLNIVPHTYQSEENQNAMKNYVQYRKKNLFAPKDMSDWEKKMWDISLYNDVFIQNRDMFRFVPFIYILTGTLYSLYTLPHGGEQLVRMYVSSVLILGDAISTFLMNNLQNDIFVDFLYLAGAVFFLFTK